MIPEIGHFSLWLALGMSLVLGTVPLLGAQTGRADLMVLARPLSYLLFFFVALAYVCLTVSFVGHDFSVRYVAALSNTALPL